MEEDCRRFSVADCTERSIDELEEFWSGLQEAELNVEIKKYQSYLNDLIASLKKENRRSPYHSLALSTGLI